MPKLLPVRSLLAFSLSFLLIAGLSTYSQAQQQVRRTQNEDEWVVDETNSLTPDAIAHINDLCNEIKDKSQADVFVVIIPTTHGKDYKKFALDLFNLWKTGDGVKDNGILVFVAKGDRSARIALGSGIDTAGHQQMAQQIFERAMVPELRAGNHGNALYKAVFQSAEQILGIQNLNSPAELPTVAVAIPRAEQPNNPLSPTVEPDPTAGRAGNNGNNRIANPNPRRNTNPNPRRNANPNPLGNARLPDPPNAAERQKQRNKALAPFFWIAGGGMGLGGLALVGGRYFSRFRQRRCPKCETELVLLDEAVEDEFLEREEKVEERIKSVSYDVWACFSCEDVIKLRHGTLLTRYSKCPSCKRQTKSKIKRTLVRATKRRGGVVQVTETCENCDYHNQYTYRTPRLPETKSGSSSGFGGSSGSGGFGRSSSSSSGRSGGGGSSRGGGGGGHW